MNAVWSGRALVGNRAGFASVEADLSLEDAWMSWHKRSSRPIAPLCRSPSHQGRQGAICREGRMLGRSGFVALAISIGACAPDATSPAARAVPSVPRAFVTGTALAALDSTGHYRHLLPPEPSPWPMLADTQAIRAVREWWLLAAGGFDDVIERDRGSTFNWQAVSPCGTA